MSEPNDKSPRDPRRSPDPDATQGSLFDGEFFILVNGRPRKVTRAEWLAWARAVAEDKKLGAANYVDCTAVGTLQVTTYFTGRAAKSLYLTRIVTHDGFDARVLRYYSCLGDAKRGHWDIVDALRAGRPPEEVK